MRLSHFPLRPQLVPKLVLGCCVMLLFPVESAMGQSICNSCSTLNQSPTASPGGPYVGMTGQSISLNGEESWADGGSISEYYWDFGDGTWGRESNTTHQYNVDGVYTVTLWVSDTNGSWDSSQTFVTVSSTSLPVKLTFDELPNNTVVADQYLNQYGVRFSSGNFFYPVHTYQNCSAFCSTTSLPNFITTKPDDYGQVTVEFTQPASNLSFYIIGIDTLSGTFGRVDVYVNGSYSVTYPINGVFNSTSGFTLGSTTNITKIIIYNSSDPFGIGIDDITFAIPADVKITNARVSGFLNGTTQNALAGADIALNASATPGGFSGGSYSWTCAGPCAVIGAANSSSVAIRSTNVGTLTATVSYVKNGVSVSGSVTINAVLPALTNFTAQQGSDYVSPPGQCISVDSFWRYKLGCMSTSQIGMHFTSSVHAPTFISDPTQSGVKYVQAVSAFRKENEVGLRCVTRRSSESNIGSGWQLDTRDPYNGDPSDPIRRFSEGNDLTMTTVDYPSNTLTFITAYEFSDVFYIDDRFEMYVVYFTGNEMTPAFQRPLGKLAWNWGGLVVLDWNGSDAIHHLRYSNASPGPRTSTAASSVVTMQGNVKPIVYVPCPGGPPLTTNRIDSSRVLVKYHYIDFLGRNPDGDATHPPDLVGWNFWTSQISQCIFDSNCIHAKRVDTGLAFFYSGEFIRTDPDLANPPGSPGFNPSVYNRAFVKYCYLKYLRRNPVDDPSGWDFWTNDLNSNGNYQHMIDAFISSTEYRNRAFS